MRIWFKTWKDNHMLQDLVIEDESEDARTHKIFGALEQACNRLDLSNPMWLEVTVRDFKRSAKARFYQDSFIDDIDFDYLEIQVLEED